MHRPPTLEKKFTTQKRGLFREKVCYQARQEEKGVAHFLGKDAFHKGGGGAYSRAKETSNGKKRRGIKGGRERRKGRNGLAEGGETGLPPWEKGLSHLSERPYVKEGEGEKRGFEFNPFGGRNGHPRAVSTNLQSKGRKAKLYPLLKGPLLGFINSFKFP